MLSRTALPSSSSPAGAIPFADSAEPHRSRAGWGVTLFAVAVLGLNAALLIAAGMVGGEPALLIWAALFVVCVVGVLVLRRRYARRLRDIAQARNQLRAELRHLHAREEPRNSS